jgi:hypothetical protein
VSFRGVLCLCILYRDESGFLYVYTFYTIPGYLYTCGHLEVVIARLPSGRISALAKIHVKNPRRTLFANLGQYKNVRFFSFLKGNESAESPPPRKYS